MIEFLKIRDGVSSDLQRKARAAKDKRPLLRAMGTAAVTLGKQAFTDSGLRPAEWLGRKDDKPHNLLMLATMLYRSVRIGDVSGDQVTIVSDRPYAAVHQLGSEKLGIPARPFLPFMADGRLTATGAERVNRALRAALKTKGIE